MAKTLYDKIWDAHVVHQEPQGPAVLYIDRHLIHEVTSPQAFQGLKDRGLKLRRPDLTTATVDHSIPTTDRSLPITDAAAKNQIETLRKNCKESGVTLYDVDTEYQGIVHVIGPELGLTQPGMTVVCGDSHTATHGAFGALAFGIGTSEVELVMASQCLLQTKSKNYRITVNGQLPKGVTPKDVILYIISKIGVGGATGHVIEYAGDVFKQMSMEGRMTVCNMSIEAGARAGLIAPDNTTFKYLNDKPAFANLTDPEKQKKLSQWQNYFTDADAHFDKELHLNAKDIAPMVTYGTNPGMGVSIEQTLPTLAEQSTENAKQELQSALNYMELKAGQMIEGTPIHVVFVGSCTNSRIEDLRAAAKVAQVGKVAPNVRALVVAGSVKVKQQAEAEGLADVFKQAGFEWREPGCSMCIAMNGDFVEAGQACASTSNRNFIGRQGKGSRTFLMSPEMAVAAALKGHITDVRKLMN